MTLSFPELVERTGSAPKVLRYVLAQEIAVARVVRTADGGFALDTATVPRDVLAGLRTLSSLRPTDDDRRRAAPTEIEVADLALVAEGGA